MTSLQQLVQRWHPSHWLILFGAILASWVYMYLMAVAPVDAHHGHHGAHHAGAASAAWLHLFIMWALMALAMMAPSLVPTLATYLDLSEAGAGSRSGFYGVIIGYLLAWVGFAVIATWLQLQLSSEQLVDPAGKSLSQPLNAALLLLAGGYQFTSLKEACLVKCRMPLTFFMEQWRDGTSGAILMGMRLGLICVVCCWALMLLGFIGGIMNLLWMGVATVFMTVEKLPQIGRYISRPTGVLLIGAGLWLAFGMINQGVA